MVDFSVKMMCINSIPIFPDTINKNSIREEELFYLFCVQGNDMHIRHNGRDYHFLSDPDYSAICDSRYTEIYKKYKNSIELIEDFEIEGRKLVDIVNELDEIEWM